MSVAHTYPSQISARRAGRFGKIAVVVGAGLLALAFLQPLAVSAEPEHQTAAQQAASEQPKAETEAAPPVRKAVRVIPIWNVSPDQAQKN
jgi:hypothetical protein